MSVIRVARRDHGFTMIDNATLEDSGLSYRARGVLCWLLAKPDDWTTNSEVIAEAGTEGRDAVRTALKELLAAGYLTRRREQLPDGRWATITDVLERPATDDGKPGVGSSGGKTQVTKTNTELPLQNTCSAEPSGAVLDATFEAFWRVYPRKVGKGAARKAWVKAMKVATIDAIMEGAERYATERAGADVSYTAHPTTWLNGQRWLDEPGANSSLSNGVKPSQRLDTDRGGPSGRIEL